MPKRHPTPASKVELTLSETDKGYILVIAVPGGEALSFCVDGPHTEVTLAQAMAEANFVIREMKYSKNELEDMPTEVDPEKRGQLLMYAVDLELPDRFLAKLPHKTLENIAHAFETPEDFIQEEVSEPKGRLIIGRNGSAYRWC